MMQGYKKKIMLTILEVAKCARERGDYAIAAAIVKDGKIIAIGGNRVKTKNDSTRHIELEIIQYVKGMTHDRYLKDYSLFCNFEPCLMCFGAAWWVGIREIYYGLSQNEMNEYAKKCGTPQHGYRRSPLSATEIIEHCDLPVKIEKIMNKECRELLYAICK